MKTGFNVTNVLTVTQEDTATATFCQTKQQHKLLISIVCLHLTDFGI